MLLGFLSFWSKKQELLELNTSLPCSPGCLPIETGSLEWARGRLSLGAWERGLILKPRCFSLAPSLSAPEMSSCYHDPVFFGQVVT